jgi:hypothetical protein
LIHSSHAAGRAVIKPLAERTVDDAPTLRIATPVEALAWRPQTKAKKLYASRKQMPESAPGIITSVMGRSAGFAVRPG